jgi:hypothetical protein
MKFYRTSRSRITEGLFSRRCENTEYNISASGAKNKFPVHGFYISCVKSQVSAVFSLEHSRNPQAHEQAPRNYEMGRS